MEPETTQAKKDRNKMGLKVTIIATAPEGQEEGWIMPPDFPVCATLHAAHLVAVYRDGLEREFRDFAALRKAHGNANLALDVTTVKYVDPVTRIQFPHTVRHRG